MVDSAQDGPGPDYERAINFGWIAQGHLRQAIEQIGERLKYRKELIEHLHSIRKWRTIVEEFLPGSGGRASGWPAKRVTGGRIPAWGTSSG